MHQLRVKQFLPITKIQAWEFLSDPKNLKSITPDFMNFKILSGADKKAYPGQIIQYSVAPILGVSMRWVTELTHLVDHQYFVDEQRFRPYAFWHHKHFISSTKDGVIMEDIIDYKLPLGALGRILNFLFVKRKLKSIFKYREEKLNELFN